MECDLKGLFKITVEETKLKEKYTVSSICKKSFRHLYYQFQFLFQSVLFRLRLKTLWFKRPNETLLRATSWSVMFTVTVTCHPHKTKSLTYSTVLNYLPHWLFNARRTLTWFAVKLSQDYPHKFYEFYILNSTCDTKAEFKNCFIIHSQWFLVSKHG